MESRRAHFSVRQGDSRMGMGMEMGKGGVDYRNGGEHENSVLITDFEII